MFAKFLNWYTKLGTADRLWKFTGILALVTFVGFFLNLLVNLTDARELFWLNSVVLLSAYATIGGYLFAFGSLLAMTLTGRDRKK